MKSTGTCLRGCGLLLATALWLAACGQSVGSETLATATSDHSDEVSPVSVAVGAVVRDEGAVADPVSPLSPVSPVTSPVTGAVEREPSRYTYKIVNTYPHDPRAFTQGLVFFDGEFYEGTGLYGRSTLRHVDMETGQVMELAVLPAHLFGEGVTLFDDRLVQLTWKEKTGLVYSREDLRQVKDFGYASEGWGLTHDGDRLIMSDGSSRLHFLDPQSFTEIGYVDVREADGPVDRLNELEYYKGQVLANVWKSNFVAMIDPATGWVTGWIDLRGLLSPEDYARQPVDVLNGIAYDEAGDRLFVTGKLWPKLFEIELVPMDVQSD